MFKAVFYEFLTCLKKLLIDVRKKKYMFFRKIYVRRILPTRSKWFLSRNHNLYNPTIKATIYRWNDAYNIARFGNHYEDYQSQKEAKKDAFRMWLEESRAYQKHNKKNL
jgi:hypothetical protein